MFLAFTGAKEYIERLAILMDLHGQFPVMAYCLGMSPLDGLHRRATAACVCAAMVYHEAENDEWRERVKELAPHGGDGFLDVDTLLDPNTKLTIIATE